jgi:molybdopterin-containing oxidoreductase family membrane subunit
MFERRFNGYTQAVGIAALVWRFALTTGTGSIFGFLVARQAYQSALLAPLFIVMSFGWGLAVFLVVQSALLAWHGKALDAAVRQRLMRLLGVFAATALYLVAVYHMTNLYFARQSSFEAFILLGRGGGTVFAALFWAGYVVLGSLLPMLLVFHPRLASERSNRAAALLVLLGAFAWLYVFIIGGQAFPLDIFPGFEMRSSFGDGAVTSYVPRWPEWLLGLGGVGAAFLVTTVGVRLFEFVPHDAPMADGGGA